MHERELNENEMINKTSEEPLITNKHILTPDQQIPNENNTLVCKSCQKVFKGLCGLKKHQKT